MHLRYPTYQDKGARFWLMVVHGENVINRVHKGDVEVSFSAIGDDFALADPAKPPARLEAAVARPASRKSLWQRLSSAR